MLIVGDGTKAPSGDGECRALHELGQAADKQAGRAGQSGDLHGERLELAQQLRTSVGLESGQKSAVTHALKR